MPRAKQLTVWVPDRPGTLGEIGSELGAKKANIRALMGTSEGGRGVIRLVVDKTATAKKALAARGWETTEEEVLEATLADNPGSLGALAQKLGKSGVNIQYAYAGSAGSARRMSVFLGVSDLKAALKAAR
jgi:hypothetical protein